MSSEKDSVTINHGDIIKVLRITSLVIIVGGTSFVLIYFGIFSCILLGLGLIYVTLPIAFYLCPHIRQVMVFQAHVDADGIDFEKPSDLKGVRNFRIPTCHGIQIGLWHILPATDAEEAEDKDENFWQQSIRSGSHKGVIIYFHGVTGTRGKWHRKELYQVLQQNGHHIIACDYRGFADSTKIKRITESGIVLDAIAVYEWVHSELLEGDTRIPVWVWGHSLGAGVLSHAIAKLQEISNVPHPHGVVLEAPFNNFADELRHHRKLKIWRRMPFFDQLFINPLKKTDVVFQNDGYISKISVPILILHAKDDNVIPSHLGKRLFEAGRLQRPKDYHPLYFVHLNYGKHNEMYKWNAEFDNILNHFVNACSKDTSICWHSQFSETMAEILCSRCIAT